MGICATYSLLMPWSAHCKVMSVVDLSPVLGVLRPTLMGDPRSTTRSHANALRCGVAITGLLAHCIFSARSQAIHCKCPLCSCAVSRRSLHDVHSEVVVTSVQRKRSVPTVMRSPWTKLYAFSLSVLYKVDLSIVS